MSASDFEGPPTLNSVPQCPLLSPRVPSRDLSSSSCDWLWSAPCEAARLGVSVKSIRRAYWKGEIPVERICRFVRFNLERVREALQAKGHWPSFVESGRKRGPRSAQDGASRRRAQRPSPRLGKTGASIADKPRRKK